MPPAGSAGLVVQSGGVGIAVLEELKRLGVGLSSFASVGDKYDVSSNDMLSWWEQDAQTTIAILYVESFGSPREFARTARRVGAKLPVLTVIGGRSAAGQRAAASHSAAAATPLITQEALFAQAGIIATHALSELVDTAGYLSCQALPAGRRVGIVSNAGGAGVLAADACEDAGLTVAMLEPATRHRLARMLPDGAAVAGPVDTTATVTAVAFRSALEAVGADPGVDVVLAIGVPTAIADLSTAITAAESGTPLAAVLFGQAAAVDLLPAATATPARGGDRARRIPVYGYPENAVRAIGRAASYQEWLVRDRWQVPDLGDIDTDGARALVAAFLTAFPGGGWLSVQDAAALLASYRIPVADSRFVTDGTAAVAAAAELGGHVAIKADVQSIVHKSDAGAVRLDLRTGEEIVAAVAEFREAFGSKLRSVLVQQMISGGIETMVGLVQDLVFGPAGHLRAWRRCHRSSRRSFRPTRPAHRRWCPGDDRRATDISAA